MNLCHCSAAFLLQSRQRPNLFLSQETHHMLNRGQWEKMAQSGPRVIIAVSGASDGDQAKWPAAGLRPEPSTTYLEKLATRYVKERGTYLQGE